MTNHGKATTKVAGRKWVRAHYTSAGKRVFSAKDVDTDDQLQVLEFECPPQAIARASLVIGRTIKTAEFEGVRIDVGVELPCYPEEFLACQAHVADLVIAEFKRHLTPVLEDLEAKKAKRAQNGG